MFERFTDRARRVVVLSQEFVRLRGELAIGTEHLLLGLAREGEGVAAKALDSLGVTVEAIEGLLVPGDSVTPSGHLPFTPQAKKVLELSLREALQLGHNYIGTEHILLAVCREGEDVAARVLIELGSPLSKVRQQVITLLAGYPPPPQTLADHAAVLAAASAEERDADRNLAHATTRHEEALAALAGARERLLAAAAKEQEAP